MVMLAGTEDHSRVAAGEGNESPAVRGLARSASQNPKKTSRRRRGLGLKESEVRVGPPGGGWGVTVSEAVCAKPELEAEIVTVVELDVALVDTGNAAIVNPAAMLTLGGTVATEVLLLDKEKTAPPLGAGALRMISPVEVFPPFTLVGFNVSENEI